MNIDQLMYMFVDIAKDGTDEQIQSYLSFLQTKGFIDTSLSLTDAKKSIKKIKKSGETYICDQLSDEDLESIIDFLLRLKEKEFESDLSLDIDVEDQKPQVEDSILDDIAKPEKPKLPTEEKKTHGLPSLSEPKPTQKSTLPQFDTIDISQTLPKLPEYKPVAPVAQKLAAKLSSSDFDGNIQSWMERITKRHDQLSSLNEQLHQKLDLFTKSASQIDNRETVLLKKEEDLLERKHILDAKEMVLFKNAPADDPTVTGVVSLIDDKYKNLKLQEDRLTNAISHKQFFLERFKSEEKRLQSSIAQLQDQLSELQEHVQALDQKRTHLEHEAYAKESKLQDLTKLHDSVESNYKSLNESADKLKHRMSIEQERLEHERQEVKKARFDLEHTRQQLHEREKELERQKFDFENELEERRERLETELGQRSAQIEARVQQQLDTITREQQRLHSLQEEVRISQQQLQDREAQMRHLYTQLESKQRDAQSRDRAITTREAELREKEYYLKSKEKELKEYISTQFDRLDGDFSQRLAVLKQYEKPRESAQANWSADPTSDSSSLHANVSTIKTLVHVAKTEALTSVDKAKKTYQHIQKLYDQLDARSKNAVYDQIISVYQAIKHAKSQ
ncbi:MAG: hypothetical protein ACMXYF_03990 [Candidatus Woesearchaeota archaeon]